MESVQNWTKLLTTQAQYETAFTSAFRPLIQYTLMTPISPNSLSIIDTDIVTNIPTVPRRELPVSELSEIVKETIRWVQLKSKRRFCANDYEVVSGDPVVKSHHYMIASQVDIPTIKSQHMSDKEKSQSLIHYVEAYAYFGM